MSSTLIGPGMVTLLVLGLAAMAVIVILAARRDRRRKAELQAWATTGGWQLREADSRWVDAFTGVPFGVGEQRRAEDVCTRTVDGRTQLAFTYRYVTYEMVTRTDAQGASHTERERRDHAFSVLAVGLPVALGPFSITRERLSDRVARAFGGQDVEIERADFNRRYRVRAEDAKLAVDLLNPRTVERLLTHRDASLRLADGWAVVYDVGALQSTFVPERLQVVADLLAGIPRFVWLDRGTEPPTPTSQDR